MIKRIEWKWGVGREVGGGRKKKKTERWKREGGEGRIEKGKVLGGRGTIGKVAGLGVGADDNASPKEDFFAKRSKMTSPAERAERGPVVVYVSHSQQNRHPLQPRRCGWVGSAQTELKLECYLHARTRSSTRVLLACSHSFRCPTVFSPVSVFFSSPVISSPSPLVVQCHLTLTYLHPTNSLLLI